MTSSGQPPRILVIEDDYASLSLVEYLLKAFGCETFASYDGGDGLVIAEKEKLDAIICDIRLPTMSGYEFVKELKSRADLRHIPVIAVTAYAMVGDREKALAAGFDDYIPKPIEPESFMSRVQAHLPRNLRPSVRPGWVESEPQQQKPAECGKGVSLLAVDDHPEPLQFIRSVLEPYGYTIVTASGVQGALALARECTPDLVISDLHMQDGTGYDLIAAMQTDAELRSVPVLLMSSTYGDTEEIREAAGANVNLLTGTVEPQKLLDAVAACTAKAGE